MRDAPPYRTTLARIHDERFGGHADLCAPGVLELLEPIRRRSGTVVEIGCGSGALTRHLVDAGHRVMATDASPAMLELVRSNVPEALGHRLLRLPQDSIPDADAIVSTGHVLSYLRTERDLLTAIRACARALRPKGLLALDLEDRSMLSAVTLPPAAWVGQDWALIIDRVSDGPSHFARVHTIFVADGDGRYRREVERHDNVLIDVAGLVPPVLEAEGLTVEIGNSFGAERLTPGLSTVVAHRTS